MKKSPIRRYNKKTADKRKEERKDYPGFFQKHIQIIKDNNSCCEECGSKLKGDVSEIAHILPKSYFKSISINDLNVLYLCGMYSDNQCHYKFDNNSVEKFKDMFVYQKVIRIFAELEKEIEEKINYKTYDKYTND